MGNRASIPGAEDVTKPTESAVHKPLCPILSDAEVDRVYNELLKPAATESRETLSDRNAIPVGLRNKPMKGQQKPLSTDRVSSNIPKGGTADTWTYPSPQMFFNALKRKGKGDDVVEDDMESVVQSHNVLNELTWRHVMSWERLHCKECPDPKLMRFCGRPDALSPKARFFSLFGDGPFDRHDWIVDRCGQHVRYIIDFYFNEEKAGHPEAFVVDARPALDSFESAHDRLKMSIYRVCVKLGIPCPITGHTSSVSEQDNLQERVQA